MTEAYTSNHTNDMTVGSPTRSILLFALPLIMGYILQQMYLVMDAAIVGHFVGVKALASVGASTSIMFLVMGFCNGSCAGFAIPIARAFGAKDYGKMRAYVANALRIGVVFAIIITFCSSILCERILKVVNTPSDIMEDAYIFLLMQFLAIPFTIGYNLLAGFIRALGNSRQPFYFLIFSSLINMVLDIILVIFMGKGVWGVGLATMISQACSCVLCGWYIKKKMKFLIPRGEERAYNNKRISILLSNGVPMGLQFSITGLGIIMLQSANNALGTSCVAAFTAAMRLKYFFICVFDNVGVAMATYCGQNIGAQNLDRVKLGIYSAMKITMVYFLFTFIIIFPLADEMMLLFVDGQEADVIAYAAEFMRINNYFYPLLALLAVLRYSIQGLGYSNLAVLSGVMEMVARTSVSLWLVPAWGFLGVCYGDPVAWFAANLFLVPAFWWLYRHLKLKINN